MSDRDAYPGEMGVLRPLDIDDPEFSSLTEEVRAVFRRTPSPEVEARHMTAIVEEAKRVASNRASLRDGRRAGGLIAKVALAAASLGLITGGLALAGVDIPLLPDQASDHARDAVARETREDEVTETPDDIIVPGVDQLPEGAGDTAKSVIATIEVNLPLLHADDISGCEFGAMVSAAARGVEADTSRCDRNGDDDGDGTGSETAARVQEAIEVNLPLLHAGGISGCEFGAMVSAAARGVEADTSRCDRNGDDDGERKGGSQGAAASAEGRARADAAKAEGQAKGEAASGGKANAGGNAGAGGKAGAGDPGDTGAANSAAGKAKADAAKAEGQAKGEAASGGKANAGGKAGN